MISTNKQPGNLLCLAALLLLLTIAPALAWGQGNASPPLPPTAQDAVDKGIVAAKKADYLLAIRFFEEARKVAPMAPPIYLNLGLAESRVPGRELRAMAWFGAYLAAYPNSPSAAAVRAQVTQLDMTNQGNVSQLIKAAEEAANQIPKSRAWLDGQWPVGDARRDALLEVADLWQKHGDYSAALKTADGFTGGVIGDFYKSMLQKNIGWAQMNAGDLKGARQTFRAAMETAIRRKHYDDVLLTTIVQIASGHAGTGDIKGALQSADKLQDDSVKSQAQFNIAVAQAFAGDAAGAYKTFARADHTAERIQNPDLRREVQAFFAKEKKGVKTGSNRNSSGQATTTTPPGLQPVIGASDWLRNLDDGDKSHDCPLNTSLFLDMGGYLKSLTSSGNPKTHLSRSIEAVKKQVSARRVIVGMLQKQAKP